ncbi:Fe-S oxidoreductase [hydrothermal vent metagenome]|uniref:Fe-S oxidoreductase n=1 Tax=hydrothermal vent metagenome TaxID=652676 RepID=A0A3B0UWC8_9ZZZZ
MGFYGIYRIVRNGRSTPPLKEIPSKMLKALIDVGLQKIIFRARPVLSTFHTLIFFGFSYFFLVNVTDLLEGFIPGFELIYGGEAIVGIFILFHVGSRFMGQVLRLAERGEADPWMPFASLVSVAFRGLSDDGFNFGIHLTWWLAIGLIVVFLPYFIRSKHFHLMTAPLNIGLSKQTPRGQLDTAVPPDNDQLTSGAPFCKI